MLRQLLLFTHLTGVIVWVGGMFFAYFCLRPAAAQVLEPAQRLPLWAATFKRFLPIAGIAVLAILLSGLAMFLQVGAKLAPAGWHLMMMLGFVMAAVFAYVYGLLYPRLSRACSESAWPQAAAALGRIRQMVALNLALSALTLGAVMFIR